MPRLASLIDENSVAGKRFAVFIQVLIVLSMITFTLETLPGLDPWSLTVFVVMEVVIVAIFTFEYILRIVLAENKLKFIFSFYGLIDLAAILPFYLATGLDLRSVRLLRLLRLLRILKLFRYSQAAQRLQRAFINVKDELFLFGFLVVVLLYLSSVGIYFFEHEAQPDQFKSILHSMWWAVATLTTVGYGDIYPVTAGGKLFTFFVLMIGLGIVAVPTGLVASALTEQRIEGREEDDKPDQDDSGTP